MSGTLYVVATPIGNLEDITIRALRVLREVDVIAAEDTRRTAKLLAHHAITTRMLSFHSHNTRARIPALLERLSKGARVALVTDAGTPGISDPGVELVQGCHQAGLRVEVIPGPSAALTAAVASGFPLDRLTILGFAPSKANDRTAFIRLVAGIDSTVTFFEAPHRISQTLQELATHLVNRQIAVARELTKRHEEVLVGSAGDIIGRLTESRGEFTVVVAPPADAGRPQQRPADRQIALEFGLTTESARTGRRGAVTALARKYGMSAREVYLIIEKYKNYVE